MQTSREIVTRSIKFKNPERMPRDIWLLPWADIHYPEVVKTFNERYPSDFITCQYYYPPSNKVTGDAYKKGEYTDEWGCTFINLQDGIIGEVKEPIIQDITDWRVVKPPYGQLPIDTKEPYDTITRFYDSTNKFVISNCCARPWERYQFLRGTENSMIDVMMPEQGGRDLLKAIHDFYLKELEFWVKADVDAIMFMDDWGAQSQLLIPPKIWRQMFKPLYKDYCDLAHSEGKFAFMHSDGCITEIYEDLIEVGVDVINSQLFTMDFAELEKKAKGKISFWGEIDRQHILPSKDPQAGRDAVRKVADHLYDPSGRIIAQFEFGMGANPETALAVFDEWEKVDREQKKQN
ncbi:methyltransferase [candidate division KSB1 bacterium]|nr:methyltransferase [candidate division KSB1 bacterium]